MALLLKHENLTAVRNPAFRQYAENCLAVYDDFVRQVEQFGLPFAEEREEELCTARESLSTLGVKRCNEGAALVWGTRCGACEACRTGVDSYTGIISLMCHRNCFFCFNPNQENYEGYSHATKDWERELRQVHRRQPDLGYVALTGGEPLLHKTEAVEYFRTARSLWPEASMRLYTSGDLLDEGTAAALRDAGVGEIRFSLKLEDTAEEREKVYQAMELAKRYFPRVMVEMPVLPDRENDMREILDRLEAMEIFGINLLELCFPYHNAEAFLERGYRLRYPPYRTLYNFWYAGGLPVDGSELLALKLLEYAAGRDFRLNVHYCSLENKHFGQVYMQNLGAAAKDRTFVMSGKDFYLKTVKVFGKDISRAERIFRAHQRTDYQLDREQGFLQFSPECAQLLKKTDMQLGISYNIREFRERESVIRELRLDLEAAADFRPEEL
ncbi:MAG: radical SAM protein [Oscillospiraceae bacterium]|nr:radical SAM protein [Oscillospiraceae bacterium]